MAERIINHESAIEFEYRGVVIRDQCIGSVALSDEQLARFQEHRRLLLSFVDVENLACLTAQRRDWLVDIVHDGFRVAIWAPQPAWFGVWRQALMLSEVSVRNGMVLGMESERPAKATVGREKTPPFLQKDVV